MLNIDIIKFVSHWKSYAPESFAYPKFRNYYTGRGIKNKMH